MYKYFFILMVGFFLTSAAQSQTAPSKNDFAFGHELSLSDQKSVVSVILPEDVYQTCKSSNLSDTAVFNSKNEMVPHTIGERDPVISTESVAPMPLKLFPIYGDKGATNMTQNLKITTSAEGAIVEINSVQQNGEAAQPLAGYLLDASLANEMIDTIHLQMSNSTANFFIKLHFDGSQDLKIWTPIESDSVLAHFEIQNEQLDRNDLELKGNRFKYYRLTLQSPVPEFKIVSAEAMFATKKQKLEDT